MNAAARGGIAALLFVSVAACGGAPFEALNDSAPPDGAADQGTMSTRDAGAVVDVQGDELVALEAGAVDADADGSAVDAPPETAPPVDAGGDGCSGAHSDGLGQSFFACDDSSPSGLADQACYAWVLSMKGSSVDCVGATPACAVDVICGRFGSACACWGIGTGTGGGHVALDGAGCRCPTASDPAWQ